MRIGSSEPYKQWGGGQLRRACRRAGQCRPWRAASWRPAERDMAQAILQRVAPALRERVLAVTGGTVAETVAAMSLVKTCLGNDTGGVQIAAAVGTPTWVMLGSRPLLNCDPKTLHNLVAARLADIQPADVARIALAQA